MKFIQKVKNTISKFEMTDDEDKIIIGISGGPDSVALLHTLIQLKKEKNIELIAAHVNYKLRDKESDEDETFVDNLCKNLYIDLHKKTCNLKKLNNDSSIQEIARNERYDFFNELYIKYNANKIAIAQNLDDSNETILFNLMRGTGSKGLSGIPPVRDKIIRPLIECTRDEILNYLKEINQNYRTDSSNIENKYSRNKIRNLLLPLMQDISKPDLNKRLFSTSQILKDENDYFEIETKKLYQQVCIIKLSNNESIYLSIPKLKDLHIALKRRLIRLAVEEISGDLLQFEKKHVDKILQFIEIEAGEKKIQLPHNLEAVKSYNTLIIKICDVGVVREPPFLEYSLIIPGINKLGENYGTIEAKILNRSEITKLKVPNNQAILDYLKCQNMRVRTRKDGDTFTPFGMKGTKKLKDYLIDKKVPKNKRDSLPIITSNDQIAWLPGFTIDDNFKVTDETTKILNLTYII